MNQGFNRDLLNACELSAPNHEVEEGFQYLANHAREMG